MDARTVRVVITTPLEPELIDAIRAVDPRLDVVVPTDLLATPGFPSNHPAPTLEPPDARRRWDELLDGAEVLFDFGPLALLDSLPRRPRLRWIQGSSAGLGRLAADAGLLETNIVVTTSSGVHARPLAEFALLALLLFGKRTLQDLHDQRTRRWERHGGEELRGKTVCVVGLGNIGREVARLARALDARVVGTVRELRGRTAEELGVDRLEPSARLDGLLADADAVVIATPDTPETARLLDARRLALLPPGAIVVNVGRGTAIDEGALAEALAAGRLAGAALDVFEREPLPVESPLWDLPNVLVSPHSAGTVAAENERIAELFRDNLGRYLAGDPLRNVLDRQRLY